MNGAGEPMANANRAVFYKTGRATRCWGDLYGFGKAVQADAVIGFNRCDWGSGRYFFGVRWLTAAIESASSLAHSKAI